VCGKEVEKGVEKMRKKWRILTLWIKCKWLRFIKIRLPR